MEHVFSVNRLSDLKPIMPDTSEAVYVLGHTRPGDGGAGLFSWLPDSRAQIDNGIVVGDTNRNMGRWHRMETDPINVRWYGASGDGTDATDGLQRALNAAAQGGTVRLPSGVYSVKRPLQIHQGTTLIGDGLLSVLQYTGPADTGCLQSAVPQRNCAFHIARLNIEVQAPRSWGIDLRGMSFSRFDQVSVHLRREITAGFYGPGDGQSPYYNVFTGCHISGTGDEHKNGCTGFLFTFDPASKYQSANANQIVGGHINTCQTAVACYGTGNVFYGQVIEQSHNGYVFGLPPGRLNDASKGTSNGIAGCYTEYVRRVIVQEHASCFVTAELVHTTGYEQVFSGQSTHNSIVITGHDGRLPESRSFVHRRVDTLT